ncbi:MAG: CotH kinase family protein [Crocinitomicaceae bacterium]|nr:CotH kinase family protein [Crocinitomicaceae bacterium]
MKTTFLVCLLFLSLNVSAAVDHWETVVYENDNWRYLVPTSTVTASWNTVGFNDASWSIGQGGFGYGDGDDNTTFGNTVSCYQRIVFNITDVNAIDLAIFNIDYDDAFVAYLNGVEISRDNISSFGQPPYNQSSDGLHEAQMYQGGSPSQFAISAAFLAANLLNGSNVLAIQTHNESLTSSDLSSRVWLSLGINDTSNDYGATPSWFNPPFNFISSNLPIVVINTAGAQNIPDAFKIDATMGIIYNGTGAINNMSDPFNEYTGDIGIEVRGSSSSGFPKKQWGLETRDPSGLSHDVSIFNMAYDNDWVLYAPYSDKSLIRNVLAYQMGWDAGHYSPRTKLCEVVLNGEYQGVYVFTEKIKRKDGKVGIDNILPGDVAGNELTGDYIFKVDKTTSGGIVAWTSNVDWSNSTDFQFHDPEISELNNTQENYLENVVTQWETALIGSNFTDPVTGHAPFIDMESFADFMLVNELTKNVDGYRISTYLHKRRDSEGGKIVAGPLWDFNLGLGNANYCEGGLTTGWEINFNNYCAGGLDNPFWWERLVQDPSFAKMLACRWAELRQGPWHTDSLMAQIDGLALYLDQAQQRNFQKWQVLGTYLWPNNFVGNTYAEEINYLKTWLTDRANWMDANMFSSCTDLGTEELTGLQLRVFPNPTSDYVIIESPVSIDEGKLYLYDSGGKEILAMDLNNVYSVQLDLSVLEQGIYQYKLQSNTTVSTGKITVK